jgi:hypothetical protein
MAQIPEAAIAAAAPCKEPKHTTLFSLYHQVSDVVNRLHALNSELGVYNAAPTACVSEENKQPPNPDTLVEVIDRLPVMLGGKIADLHNLLNDLEDSLN